MSNLRCFIDDAKAYYKHFYKLDIASAYKKYKLEGDKDVFEFASTYLVWNEIKEMYIAGEEDYDVFISFNDFLLYLFDEKSYYIRRPYYRFRGGHNRNRKTSFRQPKNNKISKKEKIEFQNKYNKNKDSRKKSWKRSYKKESLNRGKKSFRNKTKREIKNMLDDFNYEYVYSLSTGKDYDLADPWSWS